MRKIFLSTLLMVSVVFACNAQAGYQGFEFTQMAAGGTCTVCSTWDNTIKSSGITLSGGNLIATMTTNNTAKCGISTVSKTIGPGGGMWYCEITFTAGGFGQVGVATSSINTTSNSLGATGASWGYSMAGITRYNGSSTAPCLSPCTTWAVGDVMCLAIDAENGAVYIRKNNGAWLNGGSPMSGASKTGAMFTIAAGTTIFVAYGTADGAPNPALVGNFGTSLTYAPPIGYNFGWFN